MTKRCHEIDAEIKGNDIQLVEITLDPTETVIAEAGAMNYLEEGVKFEAKMGDGSDTGSGFFGKIFKAGKRAITGESLFLTHFTNESDEIKKVSFASSYPGKIIELDMEQLPDNRIICQKDSFLCAAKGTSVDMHINKKVGSGLFGGEGFIMQKLEGDGKAFLHAGGHIEKKELTGQKIFVDTGCVVAFTGDIDMSIERAGNLKSMVFGGEGLLLATLEGHGTVWIQSLPFSRMAANIVNTAGTTSSVGGGENSLLSSMKEFID